MTPIVTPWTGFSRPGSRCLATHLRWCAKQRSADLHAKMRLRICTKCCTILRTNAVTLIVASWDSGSNVTKAKSSMAGVSSVPTAIGRRKRGGWNRFPTGRAGNASATTDNGNAYTRMSRSG